MVRFPPCQSFEPVPASPAQRSGRSFGPRDSSGTLQLSTRCSSADLLLSRSLALRAGSAANCFLAISCDDAVPYAATAQLHPNNIAATRLMFEYIVETARASLMQRFELPPCSIPGQAPTQRPIAPVCHSGPRLGPQMRRLIAFASPCKRPEPWRGSLTLSNGTALNGNLTLSSIPSSLHRPKRARWRSRAARSTSSPIGCGLLASARLAIHSCFILL